MKTKIFFIIIWIFILIPTTINAEEQANSSFDSLTIRDPFQPRIPKKKKVEPAPPAPTQQQPAPIEPDQSLTIEPVEPEGPDVPAINVAQLNFNISGVIWNTDRPQAIVNNKVVDQGDILPNGAEVVMINKSEIKFLVEGIEVVIPL